MLAAIQTSQISTSRADNRGREYFNLERSHEKSVIDGFFDKFSDISKSKGRTLTRCSTDGQDRELGADYIFTNNTKFVLVEFKYEEDKLSSEKRKERRLKLCKILDKDAKRLQQSLKCHYVAWSEKKHKRTIKFNKYHSEICNSIIFGDSSGLANLEPKISERVLADNLIEDFLGDRVGASYKLFEVYVNWLLGLEGNDQGELELMLNNPDSEQLELLDFHSVHELKVWLDYNKPRLGHKPNSSNQGYGPS